MAPAGSSDLSLYCINSASSSVLRKEKKRDLASLSDTSSSLLSGIKPKVINLNKELESSAPSVISVSTISNVLFTSCTKAGILLYNFLALLIVVIPTCNVSCAANIAENGFLAKEYTDKKVSFTVEKSLCLMLRTFREGTIFSCANFAVPSLTKDIKNLASLPSSYVSDISKVTTSTVILPKYGWINTPGEPSFRTSIKASLSVK